MFITKLKFPKSNNDLFVYFWKKFEAKKRNYHSVVIKNSAEAIWVELLAPDRKTDKLKADLTDTIAEAMAVCYKEQYLRQNLRLKPLDEFTLISLIRALTIFEKTDDILSIKAGLEITSVVDIQSYYNFRLIALKEKWHQLVDLLTQNMAGFLSSSAFIELTRELVSITKAGTEQAVVTETASEYLICDPSGKLLSAPINRTDKGSKERVVADLISLAPSSVVLKLSREKSPEVVDGVEAIFTEKVVFCT